VGKEMGFTLAQPRENREFGVSAARNWLARIKKIGMGSDAVSFFFP
jgi:hypothetical protein